MVLEVREEHLVQLVNLEFRVNKVRQAKMEMWDHLEQQEILGLKD